MGLLKIYLTPTQLERLKEHKYCAQGTSLCEVFMQPYWKWLVTKVPLWMAPNLLTMAGFVLNLLTTLPVLLLDLNVEGKSPWWSYLLCAAGFFIYQSLDAIDGKQARRTGTNSPLGELFDHGCDAIATFFVAITGACALGLQQHSYLVLGFMLLVLELAFFYHWQTYVCGVLHFKTIDVTEAQFLHMLILILAGVLGTDFWSIEAPVLGVPLNMLIAIVVIVMSLYNLCVSLSIILTSGVGKNGSTVADTSVLSPMVSVIFQVPVVVMYALHSPSRLLNTDCVLFVTAFTLPIVKSIIHMLVSTMTKNPYPLLDFIMLGPLFAFANIYFGSPLPEVYVAGFLALCNWIDLVVMCTSLCQQICEFLGINCFSIPSPRQHDHKQ